jgi:hypothetical protein
MIVIGMGMAWVGYTVGIWGYCLVRGYNVKFTDLVKPVWPGTGKAAAPAPAAPAPAAPLSPRSPVNPPTSGSLGPNGTVIK